MFGGLFVGAPRTETVATPADFTSSPAAVWRMAQFYEEISGPPPVLLGWLLPRPRSSHGEKQQVGGLVRCIYDSGYLVKRMTAIEPPHAMHFEVLEQHLGIERWIRALGGSYVLRPSESGTQVTLTTAYQSRLRPRWLWGALERYLVHRLHRHILSAIERQEA